NLERPCTPKAALTAIRQIPYVGYLMGRRSRGADGRRSRGTEGTHTPAKVRQLMLIRLLQQRPFAWVRPIRRPLWLAGTCNNRISMCDLASHHAQIAKM